MSLIVRVSDENATSPPSNASMPDGAAAREGAFGAALWPSTPRRRVALLGILALAAALRLARLDAIPPGDWYDEAINGLDALRILNEPGWPLFFTTEGHPREPLYMYCVAGMFRLFGPNYLALRATSVPIALLTIWLAWVWSREWAGERRALMVALALALLRWHLHFSRLGFRTILTPLFAVLVIWLAWRMARSRRAGWALAAGGALGLGFATYLAFRVMPFVLLGAGLHAGWLRWRAARGGGGGFAPPLERARALRLAGAFALGLAIGGAPTWIDAIRHPEHLTGRAREVNPLAEGLGAGVARMARQGVDVALMFFVRGDHVAKHNIPGSLAWAQVYGWRSPGAPEVEARFEAMRLARMRGEPDPDPHGHGLPVFDPVAALFFALGTLALARRCLRDTQAFTVLLWMAAIGMTSVVSFGAPNYLRTLGMTPAVAFALAEGLDWARARVERRWGGAAGRRVGAALIALFFLHFGAIEAKRYFFDWPRHPLTWTEFTWEFADLGRRLRALPAGEVAAQVPDSIRAHPTFAFESWGRGGIAGFSAADARTLRESGAREIWVVAPMPPYPPAPVPPEWLNTRQPLEVLRRPDGVPWAAIYRGPAPPAGSGSDDEEDGSPPGATP